MAQYNLTLLYVEDDIETATSMEMILQEYFRDVYIAHTAVTALTTFQTHKIDIVLSDIELPDFSGLELIKKLKDIKETLPVILFSAYDDREYLFKAIEVSVCDYLVKPFHLEQFEEALQKCIKKLQKESVNQLAYIDQLTGACNRYKIVEKFGLLQEQNREFGFIMLDIDDFKKINDTYGHTQGDHVLQKLSSCMQKNIRQDDFFGRWGGEEFILFIPDIDRLRLLSKADYLRQELAQCDYQLQEPVTVSMGVGIYEGEASFEDLVSKVDKALYKAKRAGKNRVESI